VASGRRGCSFFRETDPGQQRGPEGKGDSLLLAIRQEINTRPLIRRTRWRALEKKRGSKRKSLQGKSQDRTAFRTRRKGEKSRVSLTQRKLTVTLYKGSARRGGYAGEIPGRSRKKKEGTPGSTGGTVRKEKKEALLHSRCSRKKRLRSTQGRRTNSSLTEAKRRSIRRK